MFAYERRYVLDTYVSIPASKELIWFMRSLLIGCRTLANLKPKCCTFLRRSLIASFMSYIASLLEPSILPSLSSL